MTVERNLQARRETRDSYLASRLPTAISPFVVFFFWLHARRANKSSKETKKSIINNFTENNVF